MKNIAGKKKTGTKSSSVHKEKPRQTNNRSKAKTSMGNAKTSMTSR